MYMNSYTRIYWQNMKTAHIDERMTKRKLLHSYILLEYIFDYMQAWFSFIFHLSLSNKSTMIHHNKTQCNDNSNEFVAHQSVDNPQLFDWNKKWICTTSIATWIISDSTKFNHTSSALHPFFPLYFVLKIDWMHIPIIKSWAKFISFNRYECCRKKCRNPSRNSFLFVLDFFVFQNWVKIPNSIIVQLICHQKTSLRWNAWKGMRNRKHGNSFRNKQLFYKNKFFCHVLSFYLKKKQNFNSINFTRICWL